ncbi:MAG: hypothetical protein V1696_03380 [Candidatus Jorgensenbacteria bacterium]
MTESQTKTCQNCKQPFTIEPDDFSYYEAINVSPPTFCPDCRLQRKMARRNERTFYKRSCDFCHTDIISMYPKGSTFKVYCNACWWSDKWDSLEYGRGFDPGKPFFTQFYELSLAVPRVALYQKNPINSPYTNHNDHLKDAYLCVDSGFSENVLYSKWLIKCKDVADSYGTRDSELCYELNECNRCARSKYLFLCSECLDSAFLYNCRGCSHCFLSSNLRNKRYIFMNEQLTKEMYEQRMSEIDLSDPAVAKDVVGKFQGEILAKTIRKYATTNKVKNSTGDYLFECKNVKHSFHVYESEDSAYSADAANLKDCYDAYEPAFNCERQYECHAGNRLSFSKFCSVSYDNHHLEYCEMCHGSDNLFGCIGLRDKKYCILNRQYSKEEYEKLVLEIIAQMKTVAYRDKGGREYRYGEFFPVELSPFAYNETVAQEYFPLSKDGAAKAAFDWREPEERNYKPTKKASDFQNIEEVPDTVIEETFECKHKGECREQCTVAFRVVPQELELYRRLDVPLPDLCPNCRHYARIAQRNPLKLWHRKCQCAGAKSENGVYSNATSHSHGMGRCPNEFETSYAPDRKEIVYCESCYNSEVV